MDKKSRTHKSILNAKVNLAFFLLNTLALFVSRKIFLEHLGADFVGLTGTLQNILGFLNLAELGISTSVCYALYKPISQGNREEICRIIAVFGLLYRRVGTFVLLAAAAVSLFLPLIFQKSLFDLGIIYFAFWSFTASSLIGYYVNYKQILLQADQKNYVVTAHFQTVVLIKTLVQIATVSYIGSLYLWIAVELLFSIVYSVAINRKIGSTYPWLTAEISLGKRVRSQYPELIRKTRQVFVHKMKDFLLMQSDQILIFAFVSLKMVAFYGNYTMVIGRLTTIFNTMLDGIVAGVGNLIAEGDGEKIYRVFWEMVFVRYLIAGTACFALYQGIQPLICLWLGEEYLLGSVMIVLLLANAFIMLSRGAVDMFNFAFGNYGDTWAAWAEGTINITITIAACSLWGLPGVLIGKIVSLVPIIVVWKPLYLYRTSFRRSIWHYWKNVGLTLACFALAFLCATFCARLLPLNPYGGYIEWAAYCLAATLIFLMLYLSGLMLLTPGARPMLQRFLRKKHR